MAYFVPIDVVGKEGHPPNYPSPARADTRQNAYRAGGLGQVGYWLILDTGFVLSNILFFTQLIFKEFLNFINAHENNSSLNNDFFINIFQLFR